MSGKAGKKKNKGKTVSLNDFLGNDAPKPAPVIDWAEESAGFDDMSMTPQYIKPVNLSALPTAPRSARMTEVDMSTLPDRPPYTAFVGNLPYECSEETIEKFFKDMEIVSVRLIEEDGRFKGFGYVEFPDRSTLVKALQLHDTMMGKRTVRVDVAESKNQDPFGKSGGRRGGGGGFGSSDLASETDGEWRRKPAERSSGFDDRSSGYGRDRGGYDNRDRGYGNRDSGFGSRDGGYGNRDGGYGNRDGGYGNRDGGFGSRDGYGSRDRSYGNKDGGFSGRDSGFGNRDREYGNSDRGYGRDRGGYDRQYSGDGRDNRRRDDNGFWSGQQNRDYDTRRDYDNRGYSDDRRGYNRDDGRDRGYDRQGSDRYDNRNNFYRHNRYENRGYGVGGGQDYRNESEQAPPTERPRLNLQPRTKPIETESKPDAPKQSSVFGDAKPVDTTAREREIEERIKKDQEKAAQQLDRPEGSGYRDRQRSYGDDRAPSRRKSYEQDDSSIRRTSESDRPRKTSQSSQDKSPRRQPRKPSKSDSGNEEREPTGPPKQNFVPAPVPKQSVWGQKKGHAPASAKPAQPSRSQYGEREEAEGDDREYDRSPEGAADNNVSRRPNIDGRETNTHPQQRSAAAEPRKYNDRRPQNTDNRPRYPASGKTNENRRRGDGGPGGRRNYNDKYNKESDNPEVRKRDSSRDSWPECDRIEDNAEAPKTRPMKELEPEKPVEFIQPSKFAALALEGEDSDE